MGDRSPTWLICPAVEDGGCPARLGRPPSFRRAFRIRLRGRSAQVILTVTLNTALDLTYRVPALKPHASHRITEVTERPGGKGVNVARVLAALGHEVTVTGFTGGATGRTVQDQLTATPGLV